MKRFFACTLFLVFSAGSAVAGDVIVTPNTAWGQPDRFQKATVIEEQYDGSRVAREETLLRITATDRIPAGVSRSREVVWPIRLIGGSL